MRRETFLESEQLNSGMGCLKKWVMQGSVVARSCISAVQKSKGDGREGQSLPGHFSNVARHCHKIKKKKLKDAGSVA